MTQTTAIHGEKVSLLRVLGPGHVWALGVGIVLVGEYMGWNFAVGKGGALAALNRLDPAGSDAAIGEGDRLVADVIARTAALRTDLASVPYVGTPTAALTVSDAVVARHAALVRRG